MIKYSYGACHFVASCSHLAVALLSPNSYCLTPTVRRGAYALRHGALLLALISTVALSTSFSLREAPALSSLELVVPTLRYGQEVERFASVDYLTRAEGTTLAEALREAGVRRVSADRLVGLASRKALVGDLGGQAAAVFRDASGKPQRLAQVLNAHEYLLVDLEAGDVSLHDREGVTAEYQVATLFYNGSVDTMLAYASFDAELSARIDRSLRHDLPIAEAFTGGIVRIVYTQKRNEDGEVLGYGDVEAVRYRVDGVDKTAVRFDEHLDVKGFFTPEGQPAQRTWLASPVPGARLSSPFNLRRRHPVLKRIKPHYGTDYAAPYGTPILAVSDGKVIARDRTRGNGRFIKIEHDARYQTQYLHMKAFARGIKPGTEVRKGQVIGYVGSSGLASGPHVCFRFWKDGKQVDHRAENLPTATELTDEAMTAFEEKEAEIAALFTPQA